MATKRVFNRFSKGKILPKHASRRVKDGKLVDPGERGEKRKLFFFGHPVKHCGYNTYRNLGIEVEPRFYNGWRAWTLGPFPEVSEEAATPEAAIRKVERQVLKKFKQIGKYIGYDVED